METAIFLFQLVETLLLLVILLLIVSFVVSFSVAMKKIQELLFKAFDNITFLTTTAREENLPKKASALISEARTMVEEARNFFSRISEVLGFPRVISTATREFFEESAKATREKAIKARTLLSAILQGIYQGWLEFRKQRPESGSAETGRQENE